jgi:hypothetical protein
MTAAFPFKWNGRLCIVRSGHMGDILITARASERYGVLS